MKKETKKKKSILAEIPVEKEEEVEKEVIQPISNTEEDIFTIKPIKDDPVEDEVTPEEVPEVVPEVAPVKKKSLKSIRSPAQIESLKRGREMRVARIRAEKEKAGIPVKKPPVQPPTPQAPQAPQAPVQLPVNHKSNNDFESFLENYQKMKKFETFVLEKNSRKQKQAVQPAPAQQVQQKPVSAPPPVQPQKLDYAFNLSRTSRRRGFY